VTWCGLSLRRRVRAGIPHDSAGRVLRKIAAVSRKYDDKTPIGMCSNAEIERLEKLALQLEEWAKVYQSNESLARAGNILHGLWLRYHNARNEV
jgi:hypothetical protein